MKIDELTAAARRRSGLDDFGDPSYLRIVARQLDDVREHGGLGRVGHWLFGENTVRSMTSRLRIVDALGRLNEDGGEEPCAPIVITGLYRSGTTLLHRLLASSPSVRAPLFWELRGLGSGLDVPAQRRAARWSRRMHRFLSPGFEDAHAIDAEDAEECFHLFEHCAPTSPWFMSEVQASAWWLVAPEQRDERFASYRFYRRQLELWASNHCGPPRPEESRSRWLLKWPFHLWNLDALHHVFPEARVIVLRRAIDQSTASTCSLAERGMKPFCKWRGASIDRSRLGDFWTRFNAEGLRRCAQHHALWGDALMEVAFTRLVAEPAQVALEIAEFCDIAPAPAEALAPLESGGRKHRYQPGDYGLR